MGKDFLKEIKIAPSKKGARRDKQPQNRFYRYSVGLYTERTRLFP